MKLFKRLEAWFWSRVIDSHLRRSTYINPPSIFDIPARTMRPAMRAVETEYKVVAHLDEWKSPGPAVANALVVQEIDRLVQLYPDFKFYVEACRKMSIRDCTILEWLQEKESRRA